MYFLLLLLAFTACKSKNSEENKLKPGELGGDLIVFHAGSLSVPLSEAFAEFKKLHPKVNILSEAAGSRESAKKISELKRYCDVFLSADFVVIQELIELNEAPWYLNFANNEMVIAYNEKSKLADQINSTNWATILSQKDVRYARSNPDSDPCGYRAVFVIKLAQKFYQIPDFNDIMLFKDNKYIRPKETDLLALLETNTVDYAIIYKSLALQHKLKFIELPQEINLSSPANQLAYEQVDIKLSGKKPGEFQQLKGEPIVYGLTIPTRAPNAEAALAFVEYFLNKNQGLKILEKNNQHSIVPSPTRTFNVLPPRLRNFASLDTSKLQP